MRKVLGLAMAFFALFAFLGCGETTTTATTASTIFSVGTDTGSYAPATTSGWEVTRTVYLQIVGPNNTVLFNGTVTVLSSNPTVYEAFVGACTTKGIAQVSASDTGFITSVDSYVNGTNSSYWMGYINGDSLLVGANSSQVRNGDYVQLKFEAVSW
ncbi:MAG TPA: DUF4430 domain-containing protein [Candidatus Izemoplasmatales bacterium]|nr:DUF4430 domain-containing protein [Bacillota bacterium]HRY77857.1 DUF4430 domain-containing protein [Candidatus Izemoplasmatales bacterium]